MIKHFNLDIMEKESNNISKETYLNLNFKNRDQEFIEEQTKRIKYNYELNMKYFDSLDKEKFSNYLSKFMEKHKFKEIFDLKNFRNVPGVYVLVLDQYKQVYIGLSERGITERIKQHWNAKKDPERLIFGRAFNSVLSIDSFGALDTTRIFVRTDGNLYGIENKIVDEYDNKYLLNRTMGGVGSPLTYTTNKGEALVAIAANSKRRDFTPFIDEKELYDSCNSLDTESYEEQKKNGFNF